MDQPGTLLRKRYRLFRKRQMQRKSDSQVISAYEQIRDRIIMYALPPKTQLSDYKLAKELSMSRAPVREAILLLERDGLVTLDENGKKIISPISLEDVVDILHVRAALESEALLLLADRGWLKPQEEKKLKAIHAKMLQAAKKGQVRDCYRYDDEFHHCFLSYADSPRISETLERMRLQMQRARWLNAANPERQSQACAEHEVLLNAILKKNTDASVRALRTHFSNSEQAFRHALQNREMVSIASMIRGFYER